jgi:streptogramin lyase
MPKALILVLIVVVIAGIVAVDSVRPSPTGSARMPLASTMLTGNTQAADGRALEGVAISARAVNGTITTSVYTDELGNYTFPALSGGKYRVWAQAVGYEAGRAEVILSPMRETRQDFTLKTTKDFTSQLSTSEYVAALPEDTPENRRMKQIFTHTCNNCHVQSYVLQNRFDEKGWRAILNRMEVIGGTFAEPDGPPDKIIQHYKGELASYLAKMRGPGPSPMKFKPYPRPTGDAARVVVTEYSVPPPESQGEFVDQDGSDWSEGIPPAFGARGVHDVAIDFNGNAWVSDNEVNRIRTFYKVDTETGKVTNFKIPGPYGMARTTHGIKADRNGTIWVGMQQITRYPWLGVQQLRSADLAGNLIRVDPKTGKYDVFTPPPGMGPPGSGLIGLTIEADVKGKIWTASRPGATVFDSATEKFTYFQAPTAGVGGYGVAGDADGNGWFCFPDFDIIGFVDYKTGKTSEIPLDPLPDKMELSTAEDRKFYEQAKSGASTGFITAQGPRRMGAYGNYVWWANWWAGSISKVDIRTHEVSYYPLPIPNSNPYVTSLDKNGNVWTALFGDNRVAKFDPNTEQWTVYLLPSLGYELRYVSVDNHKEVPEVWAASSRASKIARLQFRTKEQLQAVARTSAKGQR